MASFAALVVLLGTSTKTNDKLEALSRYFSEAPDPDKVWVIALFTGRKPKRAVTTTQLQEWCRELTGLPQWLFEESYHTVGDLAETIALLLPEPGGLMNGQPSPDPSLAWYTQQLLILAKAEDVVKKQFIIEAWQQMSREERFVFNKLITGSFRIGVSQKMIVNALELSTGTPASIIAHRISGNWDPSSVPFSELLSDQGGRPDISRPYPFYLAYALEEEPHRLGKPAEWQAEWKWDGIRGELIKREGQLFVWSRGEELMTEKFPEYQIFADLLPEGTVLDGEIISLAPNAQSAADQTQPSAPGAQSVSPPFRPRPFAALQTRIGRKNITKRQLSEAPVGFIAYDLLEFEGQDWRERPLAERRKILEKIVADAASPVLQLSPIIGFDTWDQLTAIRLQSRDQGSEGLMLKRKDAVYQVGRKRGDWWKWKIEPLVIDAVMIYAQKGHGRRSNLYTDYTFAVRDGDKLVSFAKAYSGLTDKELAEVDIFVKKNSLEKFGPVRTVRPELVFEIAFEGIAASARHKSGVALRFPRINRWRRDKSPEEINTLEDLQRMLAIYGKSS